MIRRSITIVALFALLVGGYAAAQVGGSSELPADAKAGECYARVLVPPTYETKTEQIAVRGAAKQVQVIPAKYEWVNEKVLVREATEKIEVVPVSYKWVDEKVMVTPATTTLKKIPATYETVEEKILVKPAQTVWKKGRGPIERVDHATGDIMCKVEEPAVYRTVSRRVMKSPPRTEKVEIPATYKTVRKQVVDKPATTRKVPVPAKYTTMRVKKLVSPPQEKVVDIPAEYSTVTKKVKTGDGRIEWRPILCETNMGRDIVSQLQRALQRAGHNPGPIDGIVGGRTMEAMAAYQKSKGLSQGAITMETLRSLGIEPN